MSNPTIQSSGSQACTIGTEHTLATIAAPGTYQLALGIPAAATLADVFEATPVWKLAAGGDTPQRGETVTVRGTGAAFHVRPCPPALTPVQLAFVIKQISGTGRTVAWAVENI